MRSWTRRLAATVAISGALVAGSAGPANAATLISIGNAGILNGNQIYLPVQVRVNICGNAIAILGNTFAFCTTAP